MHRGTILAGLFAAAIVTGSPAQSAEDRNQPKCVSHIFTDVNDRWALTEGTKKRKWLVMNVGEVPVIVASSANTTIPYADHEEVVTGNHSTIAEMKFGQPSVRLASAGAKTTVVVCRFFERR